MLNILRLSSTQRMNGENNGKVFGYTRNINQINKILINNIKELDQKIKKEFNSEKRKKIVNYLQQISQQKNCKTTTATSSV